MGNAYKAVFGAPSQAGSGTTAPPGVVSNTSTHSVRLLVYVPNCEGTNSTKAVAMPPGIMTSSEGDTRTGEGVEGESSYNGACALSCNTTHKQDNQNNQQTPTTTPATQHCTRCTSYRHCAGGQ